MKQVGILFDSLSTTLSSRSHHLREVAWTCYWEVLGIRRRRCWNAYERCVPTPSQRQAQILQTQLSPQELAYQESLITEREAEIREIETGIHELSEIFRDLGTLVQEQGGMLGTS